MSTLEEMLADEIEERGEDSFVAKQLRRQIAAASSGQSAEDLYVTGAVKKPQTNTA